MFEFLFLLTIISSINSYCYATFITLPTNFSSQLYHDHAISFHQPKLCDDIVVQYSGYINVGKKESYFFWFFESRENPESAPFTVWLNDGPGCSSSCKVNEDSSKVTYNKEGSWNQVSNQLFFDQPYGVEKVNSTNQAAPLAYKLFQIFFERFPKYKNLDFHFFDQPYGGHYIPAFANYILEQNLKAKHHKNHINNLKFME
ncbi:unnamed protein product [Cunninghamella blakesleeana]